MKIIVEEKASNLNKKHSTTMQTYGSIQRVISRHDNEHQILIGKRYVSNEIKRGHSKMSFFIIETVIKIFCLCRQNLYGMHE